MTLSNFTILIVNLYSIIDIEATGGNSRIGRITEIAAFKFDGKEIIDSFHTLANPEMSIPPFVQNLTGITDKMTSSAPKFEVFAKDLYDFLHGSILVAHNIKFDYSFLQMEFQKVGIDYKSDRICTIEMSKHIIPGLGAYGLSKLCKTLNIKNSDRHRAEGDALATVELFKMLQKKDQNMLLSRKLRSA